MRNLLPRPVPINAVWAMDLTFYTDASGRQQMALGIIDHGSRLVTCLHTLVNKRSWTILGYLCLAIGRYGKPGRMLVSRPLLMLTLDPLRVLALLLVVFCWNVLALESLPTLMPLSRLPEKPNSCLASLWLMLLVLVATASITAMVMPISAVRGARNESPLNSPDGHPKLLHLWPPKLPQAGRLNYQLLGLAGSDFLSW